MLGEAVGRERLVSAFRDYAKEYGGREAGPSDLREVLKESLGEVVDRLFDQWIYGWGVPEPYASDVTVGEGVIEVEVRGLGGFEIPLRVTVETTCGNFTSLEWVREGDAVRIRVKEGCEPALVVLDPLDDVPGPQGGPVTVKSEGEGCSAVTGSVSLLAATVLGILIWKKWCGRRDLNPGLERSAPRRAWQAPILTRLDHGRRT